MAIPQAALNQHVAILGKTGSGKSYAAKGIVEGLLASHRQVCVLDPTAAWWGLRLAADGKGRGFDVVLLGGAHADIPLAERSGAAVARLVTEQGASVVIDTSGFTVGEYTRWFIDFAGTLYTTIRDPLHVVIDEAHYFMPQGKTPDVDAGKMLHAGNRLMSGGRSRGIRGMLITQRPAKLHKDSLTCADTLIAMRVIAPQDRGAIKEWIDGSGDAVQGRAVLDSLAQLKRGEGWVWYPEGGHLERVSFPRIKTYDSSATPTHGAKSGPKVSEIKLDEVRAALAEAVKEAEANDPKLLRQEIARLKKERDAKQPAMDPQAIEKAVASAVAARDREWKAAQQESQRIIDSLKGRMGKAAGRLGEVLPLLSVNGEAVPKVANPQPVAAQVRTQQKTATSPLIPEKRSFDSSSDSEVGTGGLRRMLTALAQRPQGMSARQLGVRAGLSSSSGTFGTYLARGRAAGWIEGDRGHVRITDAGLSALGSYDPLPSGRDLAAYWLRELGDSGAARMLETLVDAYPESLTKDDLGERSGLSANSGTFGTYLSRLRTLELVEGRGALKASDELFE